MNKDTKENQRAKVWEINPETRSITPREPEHIPDLISEVVGPDAKFLELDNNDNVIWVSNTPTNPRFAFYFEMMGPPYCERRYNQGLIISLGSPPWDSGSIHYYLRIFDKRQDVNIPYRIL